MPGRSFLDSNILVYALTDTDLEKQLRSRSLIQARGSVISTQVLLETSNVLIRKAGARPSEVARLLRGLFTIEPISQTRVIVEDAWRIADRYGYGIFDSAIIASALAASCRTLYSEDLLHEQQIETLRVINPFARG